MTTVYGWFLRFRGQGGFAVITHHLIMQDRQRNQVQKARGTSRPGHRVCRAAPDRAAPGKGFAEDGQQDLALAHQVWLAHVCATSQSPIDCGDDASAPRLRVLLRWAIGVGWRRATLRPTTLKRGMLLLKRSA